MTSAASTHKVQPTSPKLRRDARRHLFSSASARSPSCAEGAWGQNREQALPDLPGSPPAFRRFHRAISGSGETPKRRAFQKPAKGSRSQARPRLGWPALKLPRSLPGLHSDRVRANDYTTPSVTTYITFPLPWHCGVSHNASAGKSWRRSRQRTGDQRHKRQRGSTVAEARPMKIRDECAAMSALEPRRSFTCTAACTRRIDRRRSRARPASPAENRGSRC